MKYMKGVDLTKAVNSIKMYSFIQQILSNYSVQGIMIDCEKQLTNIPSYAIGSSAAAIKMKTEIILSR